MNEQIGVTPQLALHQNQKEGQSNNHTIEQASDQIQQQEKRQEKIQNQQAHTGEVNVEQNEKKQEIIKALVKQAKEDEKVQENKVESVHIDNHHTVSEHAQIAQHKKQSIEQPLKVQESNSILIAQDAQQSQNIQQQKITDKQLQSMKINKTQEHTQQLAQQKQSNGHIDAVQQKKIQPNESKSIRLEENQQEISEEKNQNIQIVNIQIEKEGQVAITDNHQDAHIQTAQKQQPNQEKNQKELENNHPNDKFQAEDKSQQQKNKGRQSEQQKQKLIEQNEKVIILQDVDIIQVSSSKKQQQRVDSSERVQERSNQQSIQKKSEKEESKPLDIQANPNQKEVQEQSDQKIEKNVELYQTQKAKQALQVEQQKSQQPKQQKVVQNVSHQPKVSIENQHNEQQQTIQIEKQQIKEYQSKKEVNIQTQAVISPSLQIQPIVQLENNHKVEQSLKKDQQILQIEAGYTQLQQKNNEFQPVAQPQHISQVLAEIVVQIQQPSIQKLQQSKMRYRFHSQGVQSSVPDEKDKAKIVQFAQFEAIQQQQNKEQVTIKLQQQNREQVIIKEHQNNIKSHQLEKQCDPVHQNNHQQSKNEQKHNKQQVTHQLQQKQSQLKKNNIKFEANSEENKAQSKVVQQNKKVEVKQLIVILQKNQQPPKKKNLQQKYQVIQQPIIQQNHTQIQQNVIQQQQSIVNKSKILQKTQKNQQKGISQQKIIQKKSLTKNQLQLPTKQVQQSHKQKDIGKLTSYGYVHPKLNQAIGQLYLHQQAPSPPPISQKRRNLVHRRIQIYKPQKLQSQIGISSNVYSVMVGQPVRPQNADTQNMLQEIQLLKRKVRQLQLRRRLQQGSQAASEYKQQHFNSRSQNLKRDYSQNSSGLQSKDETINSRMGRKRVTGRIYKKFEGEASRRAEETQINPLQFQQNTIQNISDNKSKNLVNHDNYFSDRKVEPDKDKQNISFRVRRPSNKSYQNQFQLQDRSGAQGNVQVEDQCFQARLESENQEEKVEIIQYNYELRQPSSRNITFEENYRDFAKQFFVTIEQTPQRDWTQQQLVDLAKKTYKTFGFDIDGSKNRMLSVKKYKNCVCFKVDTQHTIVWYYDGKMYYGGWAINASGEGQKNGWGYQLQPGKSVYSGSFKQNRRHGWGIIQYLTKPRDVIYEGQWRNGFRDGKGKQVEADGSEYVGKWTRGKKHGEGEFRLYNQEHFFGIFVNGFKNGLGTQTFKNGDVYSGDYLNGKFQGKGSYTWSNHSRYDGDFLQGKRTGQGKWTANYLQQGSDSYEGEYENDRKNGYGVYTWRDGTKYQGFFLNDMKHGQGTIDYGDGKRIKLQWNEGKVIKRQKQRLSQNTEQKTKTLVKESSRKTSQRGEKESPKSIKFRVGDRASSGKTSEYDRN